MIRDTNNLSQLLLYPHYVMILIVVLFCPSLGSLQTQKFTSFNPLQLSSTNGAHAYMTHDSQVSSTNDYWDIQLQSEPQSPYDLKVSLNDEWGFKSNAISTISLTINGEPPVDIGNDMTLYLVFAVADTQYISVSAHLDKNGNKYVTYPKLVNIKQKVSEWISNIHLYPKRHDRVSNNAEWIENNPPYTARAAWPITFEFTNDPIHNRITYQLYSNTAAITGRQYIASFAANRNIEAYIMTNEPEDHLFISDITVTLAYDATDTLTPLPTVQQTYSSPPKSAATVTQSINTIQPTIFPSSTITSNIVTVQYVSNDGRNVFHEPILITTGCSILSFLIGMMVTMMICRIKLKQIKCKPENAHEAVPPEADRANAANHDVLDIPFEVSKTLTHSDRNEMVKERIHLIHHNSDAHSEHNSNSVMALDTAHLVRNCHNTQSIVVQLDDDDEDEDDEDEYEDMYTTTTVTAAHCVITPRTLDLDINSFQMARSRHSSSFNMAQKDEYMIRQWLETEVELPQYLDNFQRFGYQSLKFIREISNKSELSEIGIVIKGHQTKIMAEIQKLSHEYNNTQIEGQNSNQS